MASHASSAHDSFPGTASADIATTSSGQSRTVRQNSFLTRSSDLTRVLIAGTELMRHSRSARQERVFVQRRRVFVRATADRARSKTQSILTCGDANAGSPRKAGWVVTNPGSSGTDQPAL